MDGLYFLLSVIGIGLIMWWTLQNDRVPPDKPTTGLFAMLPGRLLLKRRGLRGWLGGQSGDGDSGERPAAGGRPMPGHRSGHRKPPPRGTPF
jgi:hypothetical protein